MKMVVKFNAKVWKTGDSFVVTIPKDFVTHGIVAVGKEYNVCIKNNKKEEESKSQAGQDSG